MLTTSQVINDNSSPSHISSNILLKSQNFDHITREMLINNYTQETIDSCWEALSTNIIQNYQKGKGTYIKNLGTFTYKSEEVNLEGITNQYIYDKRPRYPIFLVSKEFCKDFAAGEYTKQNSIIYYVQKENKNIPILNLNYSQIAYSLSMTRDEVFNLISNLVLYMMESIDQYLIWYHQYF